MAGAQCTGATVHVPLFVVHGALYALDTVFSVDSLIPDPSYQNLRSAEYTAIALHTGLVVHYTPIGGLVYPALAALHHHGQQSSQPPVHRPGTALCAVCYSPAALYSHVTDSCFLHTSFHLIWLHSVKS